MSNIGNRLFEVDVYGEFADCPAAAQDFMQALQVKLREAADEIERLRGALTIVPGTVTEEERQWAIDEIANAVGDIGEECAKRIANARNDALEEAALAAEARRPQNSHRHSSQYAEMSDVIARDIAARIRAMKENERAAP